MDILGGIGDIFGKVMGFFKGSNGNIDPGTLDLLKTAIGGVSGVAGGVADAKQNSVNNAFRQQQADRNYGLTSGQAAMNASRYAQDTPMRDQVMYKLSQFLKQTPGQFQPHDIFNGGGTNTPGGYDVPALQTADAAYRPGMGGARSDVANKFLQTLGYPSGGSTPGNTPGSRFSGFMLPRGLS